MKKTLLFAFLLASCHTQTSEDEQCDMTDYYIGDVSVTPVLSNTCEEAGATRAQRTKDYSSLEQFPLRLIVKRGGARFRTSPTFNAARLDNVLGFIAEKNEIYASGPIKNSDYGIYYTIPVVDVRGELCLAYVSIAVVSEKR